jgi:hypothetical protein
MPSAKPYSLNFIASHLSLPYTKNSVAFHWAKIYLISTMTCQVFSVQPNPVSTEGVEPVDYLIGIDLKLFTAKNYYHQISDMRPDSIVNTSSIRRIVSTGLYDILLSTRPLERREEDNQSVGLALILQDHPLLISALHIVITRRGI